MTELMVEPELDLQPWLVHIFAETSEPLSAAQLLKQIPAAVRPTLQQLESSLARLAVNYPGPRGSRTYLDRDAATYAGERIRRLLRRGPLSHAEIVRTVAGLKAFSELGRKGVEQAFERLVKEEAIFKLPPFVGSRIALFAIERDQTEHYLRHALQKVQEKLSLSEASLRNWLSRLVQELDVGSAAAVETVPVSTNVSAGALLHSGMDRQTPHPAAASAVASTMLTAGAPGEAVRHGTAESSVSAGTDPSGQPPAPSPVSSSGAVSSSGETVSETGRLLLDAIRDINPRAATGDLIRIAELRQRLEWQMERPVFDRELLDLAARKRIALHPFDRAATLTESEREFLLSDGAGKWFNAVSLWRTA